ncbi:MAG TPA: UvrD-helicase domain-containing protein, partial [Chloroflexia bacterium]|nr:UvrD-helicase domain-containing protein [Chloroflexia bacterium]
EPAPAGDFLAEAGAALSVEYYPLSPTDPLLYGAEAWIEVSGGEASVYYNRDVPEWKAAFYVAHELGHLLMHAGSPGCHEADLDIEAAETGTQSAEKRVEGYGPRERREREANVFARELLLPSDLLRRLFVDEGLNAGQIAFRLGLLPSLVYHQLSYALLAPIAPDEAAKDAAEHPPLDESQSRAAAIERGPLLVEAGPGTGKTRTLVGRVLALLGQDVPPTSILALTFSNKAAQELRDRVAAVLPEAAPEVWMGTFHAFGLELLRKYGTYLGLPPTVKVADPVDALLALERALPSLRLNHYMNLYEPSTYLRDILGAISRAKDELAGPDLYEELARAMLASAQDEEEIAAAEKALEVAGVYRYYQAYLEREGVVDYGDLIMKAVVLLRDHPSVRARVQAQYRHILVDEYQDVNRASALLLRHLAAGGAGLWAVGDVRQAIYRFRGAAPHNMVHFQEDFPGAVALPLGVNYRSLPGVVSAFSHLAGNMRAARSLSAPDWHARRAVEGLPGRVMYEIAEDEVAESQGIAREIERLHDEGIAYRDQAVLCRSHSALGRMGARLEQMGVPVLYLGDLFEREEARDMLSLLDLAANGHAHALLRVARFPEYAVPFADVRAVLAAAYEGDISLEEAVQAAVDGDAVSEAGKAGLALLSAHLEEIAGLPAWKALARYLFRTSEYLRALLADDSVTAQQRRLALFQLLQFAADMDNRPDAGESGMPVRYFLEYVRRMELFGDERGLRQVPEWADHIDAVRLLTIHASKGLEFRAVFLPGLGAGIFPARDQWEPCPPPPGLLPPEEEDWHEEEEECLFFVALSRARDVLCLSRAKRYGKRASNPSRFLTALEAVLPRPADGPVTWPRLESSEPGHRAPSSMRLPELAPDSQWFTLRTLELYMQCPRRYLYEYALRLQAEPEAAAYARFHRAVYRTLAWARQERDAGRAVTLESARQRLSEVWAEAGLAGYVYEDIYREQAEQMVERGLDRLQSIPPGQDESRWWVDLPAGGVLVEPDHVEVEPGPPETVRVMRLRTGRPTAAAKKEDVYALYQRAAATAYPSATVQVQALYLSVGEAEDVPLSEKNIESRLEKYNDALSRMRDGHFEPKPDDRRCPRCPYYFVCPAGGETP